MTLALIPQPKKLAEQQGSFPIPSRGTVGISHNSLYSVAELAKAVLPDHAIRIGTPGVKDTLTLGLDGNVKPGGYRLAITRSALRLAAESVAAAFHGMQTLRQIASHRRRATPSPRRGTSVTAFFREVSPGRSYPGPTPRPLGASVFSTGNAACCIV